MKNGLRISLAFVIIALLICGSMTMMFRIKSDAVAHLYRENLLGNIAFEVRQYVNQIEYGLKYGKELENYFGIDRLLSKCYTSSSYLRGIFVFDMKGKLLYSMGTQEDNIPNASATPLNGAAYAVRAWREAEYVIMDIRDEQDVVAGRLMIRLEAALLDNTIAEQENLALWQSLCIAAEGILLSAILLIHRLKKNKKPLGLFKAALFIACCTLLPVCADALVQDIRFASIAEASTTRSVQRVAQMLQQQVDNMVGLGVLPEVYDINGYLQRLQEGVDNVAFLRLNENGVIYAGASEAYVNAATAQYRAQAIQYILLLFAGAASLPAAAALIEYVISPRRRSARQLAAIKRGMDAAVEEARGILLKNPMQNAFLLACLNDGFADEVYVCEEDVCLHDRISGAYYFSVHSAEAFRALYAPVREKAHTLFINKCGLADEIEGLLQGYSILPYTQWMLREDAALHVADIEGVHFIRLAEEHIPLILERYHSTEFSPENVCERVRTQNSVGALINGALVGFVLAHYNGEIGPNIVLPAYRGKGIGTNILIRINRLQREQGRPCFGFAKPENVVSHKMLAKAGYVMTSEDTLWVYRSEGKEGQAL